MKNLYRITSKTGATICFQAADNAKDATSFARMYGHRGAKSAEFVRES